MLKWLLKSRLILIPLIVASAILPFAMSLLPLGAYAPVGLALWSAA